MKMILAMAAFAMGSAALAEDTKQAEQTQPGAEAPKAERKICRREETSVGLYGSRRVCMTAAEWKQRDHNSDDLDPRASGNAHN
ncbi:MAG: hypothetical protein QOE79_2621 [Sphingomonadales bacterium]|jgi:hypothetical protein|nr:hypothetical protein [Sphingomonadales bacterium]MEA3048968.1 hypothetical protein [Sphingomonadales bacterium]